MLKNISIPLDKNHRIFPLKGKEWMALFILPFRGRIEVGVGFGKVKMALLILPLRGRIEVRVGVTWRPSR
jgi:hypothetical protein